MSLYTSIAQYLQYISPSFYKKRFFKKLINLSENNVFPRKVEPEFLWIQTFLKKDDVFVDIGANVGAYLFVTDQLLASQNIIGFEPNKNLYRRLKRIFKNLQIYDIALSDENTEAEFKVPTIDGKKVHSRGTLQTDLKEDNEEKSVFQKVKVQKMDDWEGLKNLKEINFIKIDVEGNEFKTVKGAENTIKKYKPTLMIEIEQRHHQEPIWNFIEEIKNWGYTANFLERSTLSIAPLTQEIIEKQNAENVKKHQQYINNIIFIPK